MSGTRGWTLTAATVSQSVDPALQILSKALRNRQHTQFGSSNIYSKANSVVSPLLHNPEGLSAFPFLVLEISLCLETNVDLNLIRFGFHSRGVEPNQIFQLPKETQLPTPREQKILLILSSAGTKQGVLASTCIQWFHQGPRRTRHSSCDVE